MATGYSTGYFANESYVVFYPTTNRSHVCYSRDEYEYYQRLIRQRQMQIQQQAYPMYATEYIAGTSTVSTGCSPVNEPKKTNSKLKSLIAYYYQRK